MTNPAGAAIVNATGPIQSGRAWRGNMLATSPRHCRGTCGQARPDRTGAAEITNAAGCVTGTQLETGSSKGANPRPGGLVTTSCCLGTPVSRTIKPSLVVPPNWWAYVLWTATPCLPRKAVPDGRRADGDSHGLPPPTGGRRRPARC